MPSNFEHSNKFPWPFFIHSFLIALSMLLLLINHCEARPKLPSAPDERPLGVEEPGGGGRMRTFGFTNHREKVPLPAAYFPQIVEIDPFAPPSPSPLSSPPLMGPEAANDALGELVERLGRSELIQSIIGIMGRINGRGMEFADDAQGRRDNSPATRNEQRIERRSAIRNNNEQGGGTLRIGRVDIKRRPQANHSLAVHHPHLSFPRSPTLRNPSPPAPNRPEERRFPEFSENIDAKPLTIAKPSEERGFAPAPASKGQDEMAAFHEAIGKEWKHALFGRSGLLTEIFNIVNDKRKEGLARQAQAAPNLNDKSNDFTRILDSLLRKAQTGDFDEPLPEIPFIGICNRLSCADIYKAVDEFRKSEFFSNFQTAISLLNDPKGFDMIGELLANPELLENFSGPESLGELFGPAGREAGKKSAKKAAGELGEIGENTDSENIGVDFSSFVDGTGGTVGTDKVVKSNRPEISTSIDSDYYSSVDDKIVPSSSGGHGQNVREEKSLGIPAKQVPERRGNVTTTRTTMAPEAASAKDRRFESRPLPEIAESIDAKPPTENMDEEDEFPEEVNGPMTFEKSEIVPSAGGGITLNNGTRKVVLTPIVDVQLGRGRQKLGSSAIVGAAKGREEDSRRRASVVTTSSSRMPQTSSIERTKTASRNPNGRHSIGTSTSRASPIVTMATPKSQMSTTTRRNFRRDDDYYAMYYDGDG